MESSSNAPDDPSEPLREAGVASGAPVPETSTAASTSVDSVPGGRSCLVALCVLAIAGYGFFVWLTRPNLNRHLDKLYEGMPYAEVERILPRSIVTHPLDKLKPHFLMNGTEVQHFLMEISVGEDSASLVFDAETNLICFPKKVRRFVFVPSTNAPAAPEEPAPHAESAESPSGRAPSRPEGGSGEAEPPPSVAPPPAP